ncbi:MAG: DNA-binding protein, partial [Verrucomicrobia bacterium]
EERPKPADLETPRQTEPEPEETTTPPETPSNGDSEPEEAKRGFFSRLLRRTDY